MHIEHSSPENLYQAFAQTATNAVSDIQRFTKTMHDSGNKEVLERAQESRATNNKGIMGWLVTQHEDWFQGAAEDGIRDLKLDEGDEADENNSKHGAEDILQLLANFREAHPGIEVLMDEEGQKLEVLSIAPSPGGNHTELTRFNSLVPRAYVSISTQNSKPETPPSIL